MFSDSEHRPGPTDCLDGSFREGLTWHGSGVSNRWGPLLQPTGTVSYLTRPSAQPHGVRGAGSATWHRMTRELAIVSAALTGGHHLTGRRATSTSRARQYAEAGAGAIELRATSYERRQAASRRNTELPEGVSQPRLSRGIPAWRAPLAGT